MTRESAGSFGTKPAKHKKKIVQVDSSESSDMETKKDFKQDKIIEWEKPIVVTSVLERMKLAVEQK